MIRLSMCLASTSASSRRALAYLLGTMSVAWLHACGGAAVSAPPVQAASQPNAIEVVPELKETDQASSRPNEAGIPERARQEYQTALTLVGGDPEAALAAFERALAVEPKYCSARVNVGLLKERRKRAGEALADYTRAVELDPTCGAAWAAQAKIQLRGGAVSEADVTVRKGLAASPNDLMLRNTLAEVLLAQNKVREAEAQALQVLKLEERNAFAMLNLSRSYMLQRKPELARLAAENAQGVEPGNAEVLHHLAVLQLERNERAKALALFRRAAFLRPDLVASQINLSQLLGEAGDFEGALKAAQAAVEFDPAATRATLAVANAMRGVQRYRDAEQGYQKLLDPLSQAPESVKKDASYNLAILYLDAELEGIDVEARLELAIKQFNSYLERHKPGSDESQVVNQYVSQAKRQIEAEKKRKERDEKKRQKDAEKKASSQPASAPSSETSSPSK